MEKMSNIPELYVTNRSFEDVCKMAHLTQEEIYSLPEGAYVLEIGSGVFQNFAKKLKEIRPDLHPISIDPTVGISSKDSKLFDSKVIRSDNGDIDTAIYINKNVESNFIVPKAANKEDLNKLQNLRLSEASKTGGVISALAPDLPLKSNTFDLIVDVYGPILYIQLNQEKKLLPYFKEIYRILKKGGVIKIFPAIDMEKELKRKNIDDETSLEFSKIFFHQMFSMNELNFDITFEEGFEPGTNRKMLVMVLAKL